MSFKIEDIIAIILLVIVSVMLGCQYMDNKHKKQKMKYTCGVEGDCVMSINGTYDTKQECESKCGGKMNI